MNKIIEWLKYTLGIGTPNYDYYSPKMFMKAMKDCSHISILKETVNCKEVTGIHNGMYLVEGDDEHIYIVFNEERCQISLALDEGFIVIFRGGKAPYVANTPRHLIEIMLGVCDFDLPSHINYNFPDWI